ncbi:MAG: FtsX-like permease family protein [Candidatus Calescibacterium sp.]|nr:hypothetical protein [Candidatus Calescibacterium sp.]MCX7972572.1 hypothetical protein [bacterium]MDW8195793.1 FtsX-like permease family protein [Candidatus Calescibacterium sp.]
MLNVAIKIAKSSVLYRKERTILTTFSIAFSILISFILLSLVQGFLAVIEKSIKNKTVEMIITTKEIPIEIGPIIINPSINHVPFELYTTLIIYENEYYMTPVFKSIVNINNMLIPLISIDLEKINHFYHQIEPPPSQDYVLIGTKISHIIKSDTIKINDREFKTYTLKKELKGYEDYSIFIDFRKYLEISNRKNFDQIWINSITDIKTLSNIVNKYPNVVLTEYKKLNYIQETIISGLKVLQVIMIIASISIALIASTNTILITTFERIPEFTIILAIGSPRTVVFLSLLIEGIMISSIATLIALLLGIISTLLIGNSIQSALNISIPIMASIYTVVQQIIGISIFIGITSSVLPAYIASSIDIQSNIRI